jgi:hypothetical protein
MNTDDEHLSDLYEWLVRTVGIAGLLGTVVAAMAAAVTMASDDGDKLWASPACGLLATLVFLVLAKAPRPDRFDAATDDGGDLTRHRPELQRR